MAANQQAKRKAILEARDLEERLRWFEEAQARHPEAKIEHVDWVINVDDVQ